MGLWLGIFGLESWARGAGILKLGEPSGPVAVGEPWMGKL